MNDPDARHDGRVSQSRINRTLPSSNVEASSLFRSTRPSAMSQETGICGEGTGSPGH
jgi:hypothetical protein